MRLKQSNLIGPAGFVSIDDGVIGEWVQRGIAGRGAEAKCGDGDGRARDRLHHRLARHRGDAARILAGLPEPDGMVTA